MPYRNPPFTVEQVFTASDIKEIVDWGLALTGVPEVWKKTKGAGVKVAVLDTGVAMEHPDLKNQIIEARDFTRSAFGVYDKQGHGTHCCGVIAAEENGAGVIGVAPESKLIVGKALGDDGSGQGRDIANAIDWAVVVGARIISMSLGSPFDDIYIHAAVKRAVSKGVIVICAAGNEGQNTKHTNFPGAIKPESFTVAAIDKMGRVAEYSSSGPEVDVAAPGSDVLSCYPPSGYARLSGTSMATPFVAGVVALVLSAGVPIESVHVLRELVKKSAIDSGLPGHDASFGWGLIHPGAMLPPDKMPEPPPENETIIRDGIVIDGVAGTLIFRRK